MQALCLWPTWVWMYQRMLDGSDDPLGILALAMLAFTLWQIRHKLRPTPAKTWLWTGLALTLLATLSLGRLPPLLTGLIAMAAMAISTLAYIPLHIARLPIFTLAILALPLLSSVQFYAGYPLRIVTAEVSSWLLALTYEVQREGSTLIVNNRQIIVDAPCSGVQMAWLGYFTACSTALWGRLNNARFILRMPFVSLIILAGNIIRNSLLVALQAGPAPLASWLHETIGLVILALVCLAINRLMQNTAPPVKTQLTQQTPAPPTRTPSSTPRTLHLYASAAILCLCLLWTTHHAWANSPAETENNTQNTFVEWAYQWEGTPLRPQAFTEVEQRFAQNFPGNITRMTDGQRTFIFRHISRPTRMLHPAADCYKSLGYRIHSEQLHTDTSGILWRCFMATRQGQTLRVCEHIEDNLGQPYTDTSAWYWSAISNPASGPWTAITIAQPVGITN